MGMGKVRIRKVWWFSSNEFCKTIGCLILVTTFGFGGRGYEGIRSKKKISGKKRNIFYIRVRVYFYEFCVYSI